MVSQDENKPNLPFFAFEGIDGSGKSTQAKILADRLTLEGYKVYSTFEPTNSSIGQIIRNILRGNQTADQRVIAGLFVADRLNHLLNEEDGIVKKLKEGYIVITDRYYFSSYAYNGLYTDIDWVIAANSMSANILRPLLNIFIDVTPEQAMERITTNRTNVELFETLQTLTDVRNNFFLAFDKLKTKENVVILDGKQNINQLSTNIWDTIQPLL